MEQAEWCVLAHVDIAPRSLNTEPEPILNAYIERALDDPGVIQAGILQSTTRRNHFELIVRYESESAYLDHLSAPSYLALRNDIASGLGSPYEYRLHRARGPQQWPVATKGSHVVITQLEVRPEHLVIALPIIEAIATEQQAARLFGGSVLLERRTYGANNLEIVSVWENDVAFSEHIAEPKLQLLRSSLAELLVAPIDDRSHELMAGTWSIS